jgi:hypothetical protein
MQIRIKSTPPGEAPEHIRQAWVGLVIPVPPRFKGRRLGFGFGVLSAPKTFIGSLLGLLCFKGQRDIGYIVESNVAINLLAARSPEAADWWRQNTPQFTAPGKYFMFAAEA